MVGQYNIGIKDNNLDVILTIRNNITVIKGYSGSGKSTIVRSISEWKRYGSNSGIEINCDCNIDVLDDITTMESKLKSANDNTIFFVDEYCRFVRSRYFATLLQKYGNYIVIVSRYAKICTLSYSIYAIYELYTSGGITKLREYYRNDDSKIKPDLVIKG